jgi:hypothetical protein
MCNRPWRVGVRLSKEERKRIWEQADASRLSVSEFIRRRALGKRITPQSDLRVLAELRRLGGLLKYIHLETRGAYSRDTASAIRALESYARALERKCREKALENTGNESAESGFLDSQSTEQA